MFSRVEEAVTDIDAAQRAVEVARIAHSKGGSVTAVVKADRRLADAHYEYRCVSGGNIALNNRR